MNEENNEMNNFDDNLELNISNKESFVFESIATIILVILLIVLNFKNLFGINYVMHFNQDFKDWNYLTSITFIVYTLLLVLCILCLLDKLNAKWVLLGICFFIILAILFNFLTQLFEESKFLSPSWDDFSNNNKFVITGYIVLILNLLFSLILL